ncbi:MAG TPA: phytanoyl-CoA dioxygenase [Myxococcales bacterium]|nr:phytanoyl-CoA dioxygenase [Myxococcales bacterium]HAN30197.1 phytanoyl-CoA dioxygenase [Myxococcales bacterium]|tara:strand:- start:1153 stop:1959 length:807 start_codon:yes stop_codon:yes gene_type:complete
MSSMTSIVSKPHSWTEQQQRDFQTRGYIRLRGSLDGSALTELRSWVDDLTSWPEMPGKWMKWFERDGDKRTLCRMEDLLPHHEGLRDWCYSATLTDLVSSLMGEKAVLFKEKINFKLPGGGAYGAHQDAPAFASYGHHYHITAMVAVDPATATNGALEMGPPCGRGTILSQRSDGTLSGEDEMSWRLEPLDAGDIIFFDSYVPHRSHPNQSDRSRRAFFITWNQASLGEVRQQYFADKRRLFPPECERQDGVDYGAAAATFNLGNPIR